MARSKRILDRITTGRFTLPVVILLSVLYWAFTVSYTGASSDLWMKQGWVLLFYSVMGYFLVLLNSVYAFIRKKSATQIMIYSVLLSLFPSIHNFDVEMLLLACCIASFYFLFRSYRKPYPMADLFYVSLFWSIGTLLIPQAVWMLPLFVWGANLFRALNIRSFFAFVLGLMLPYWLLFSYAYIFGKMELFVQPFATMFVWDTFKALDTERIFSLAYFLLWLSVCSVHCFRSGYAENQRTRNFLHFLILASFYVLGVIIIQPCLYNSLLPILILITSILGGHYLALSRSRASDLFFIVFLIATLGMMFFNIHSLL